MRLITPSFPTAVAEAVGIIPAGNLHDIVVPGLGVALFYDLCPRFPREPVFLSESQRSRLEGCESSRPVADATFSYSGGIMHIRRLARNATFIMIAAMVMGGFSTGIAGATSAAPMSTVSAVSSGGGAIPRMPASCGYHFCTLGLAPRVGEYIIQEFSCTIATNHGGIRNPIYGMQNNCSVRVWYTNPSGHCISPHTSLAGVGRFGTVITIGVSTNHSNC